MTLKPEVTLSAFVATAAMLAGCADTITGAPHPRPEATPAVTTSPNTQAFAWLAAVFPTAAELNNSVGYYIASGDIQPSTGDLHVLRNTMVGQEVTEPQCIGVVSPIEQRTFDSLQVNAATFVNIGSTTIGAVAVASVDKAAAAFDSFAMQWQDCDGKKVVNADRLNTFENEIGSVTRVGAVISAIVTVSNPDKGVPVTTERAVGVAKDCIVDIEVPVEEAPPGAPSRDGAAIRIAKLMMAKINAARR
jgi:hypothetical protein